MKTAPEIPQRRITAQDLIALRLPVDLAPSPDGRTLALTVADVDFGHGEHDVQLYLAPDPDPPPAHAPAPGAPGASAAHAAPAARAGHAAPAARPCPSSGRGTPEAPAAGPDPFPVRQLTHGLSHIGSPAWSPDGRNLAFVTFRPQPHEDEEDDQREDGSDKDQVFLLPRSGGEARRLTEAPEGVEAFRWAADGSGVYFAGPAPRPAAERGWRRRRREAKEDAIVVHGDVPAWEFWFQPLDGHACRLHGGVKGVDDFDVSPDGNLLVYATNHTGRNEDSDRTEVIVRDLRDGSERRLTGGRGGAETAPTFTSDGRFVLFHGWADPAFAFSRQELFAVELANSDGQTKGQPDGQPEGPTKGQPDGPPRALLAGVDRDLEEFEPLPDGRVAALVAWGMESRLVILDPATGAHRFVPTTGRYLTHLAVARTSGRVAVVSEDAGSLPEAGFLDLADGAFERLTDLNPDAAEWRRAERHRVRWTNEGLEHEGLLLLPAAEDRLGPGPPPLLVWLHGGPHWRVTDTLRAYDAEVFAGEGFAVFLPQYRGSSGYAENYQLAIRNDLGGAESRDILAGVDEVARRGLADASRAALAGASYGGYLTNWLLATTDRFKAGVSMAGIFDLGQDFSTSEYGSWETHYLGGTPWDKPQLYRERSPLTHAASITAPLLILHGLEDDNTVVTNAKGLYRALLTLGRTVEFVVYPREGHGLSEPAHRLDECQRTIEWLARHVLGGATPRLAGREVAAGGLTLTLLGHVARREFNGVRPAHGRVFAEVTALVQAAEQGPDALRLVTAGPRSDIVLVDGHGGLFRPVGVPIEVHGHPLLLLGGGTVEARRGEDQRPPTLPVAAVFELPDEAATYRLRVFDLPPVLVQLEPPDDDGPPEDEAPAAGDAPAPESESALAARRRRPLSR
jgi:dipeptidyl aminopeptidase/acylaminoacyl peptidase